MCRILIAGLGSIGRRWLDNLKQLGIRDVLLYRTRLEPLREAPDLPVFTDLSKALAMEPDIVIVSNPTAYHLDIALPAATAGRHLFIEKPLSHSLDGLDRLTTVVQEKALRVLVGFQFRFHPGLRLVNYLLLEGAIGPVISAHAHWGEYLPDWHPWEDYRQSYSARDDLGGGALLTLSHPLDYLRWLMGEVQTVSAVTGQLSGLDVDVEDTADVTLRFASGAIGTVHMDYVQRPPSHWLHIIGQTGTLQWDNADGTVRLYRADTSEWEIFPAPLDFERNTMFVDEMRHFLDCIAGRAKPLITLEDGIRDLAIVLAAKRSAVEGRVIKVSNA